MNLKFYSDNEHCKNSLQLLCIFSQFLIQGFLFEMISAEKPRADFPCGKTNLSDFKGTITSPNYPDAYPHEIKCEWKIHSPEKSVTTLNLVDLDIEEDAPCLEPPCCSSQWLLFPKGENGESKLLCGNYSTSKTITLSQPVLSIAYFSSKSKRDRRGFEMTYQIKVRDCDSHELKCMNEKCISNVRLCNGIDDCGDGSDEKNCSYSGHSSKFEFLPRKILDVSNQEYDICGEGKIPCKLSPDHCYSAIDACDDEFDCPNGEDEVGCTAECPDQIACSSGGCYYPSQRCNYKRNCRDNSDETGCPPEPCIALQFTCLNGACVPGSALCDGDDDCGDFSDEENCAKSSFMAAAIMGLLSCIFLFCIGISCLYRVYTIRLRASAGFAHHLEPEPTDDEFIYREPPPAYSVAVADGGLFPYHHHLHQHHPQFTERYFESYQHPPRHPRNPRHSRRRQRSVGALERVSTFRSRPRPSNGLSVPVNPSISQLSEVQTWPKLIDCNKAESASGRSNFEGVIELLGFPKEVTHSQENPVQGTYQSGSPCSSLSLSPSRESVTSSTSLEDQEDLYRNEFCQS